VSPPPVVIALLCMSGYLIWRNWKRKNTKSMNFGNPVYRKTTEEEEEDELHIGRTAQIGHVYPAVSIPCRKDSFLPSFPSFPSPSLPPPFRHLSRTNHVPGIVLGPGDTEMLGQVVGVEGYQNHLVPRSSSWSKEACLCAEQVFRTCGLEG